MGYTNFQGILKKIGLVPIVIKSGEYKDIGSRSREMTETEQKMLQNMVDKIHSQFISAIAKGRNMDPAKVASLADGRLFLGEEAKELGLVDRLGNIEDAIEWAGRMGGIKGDIAAVYAKDKRLSFIWQFIDSSVRTLARQIANPEISADYLYNPAG
jgi:protease-4